MEKKYNDIKESKEFYFKQIKDAEEALKILRECCDHPDEHIESVTFSYGPGRYSPGTKMCGICGEMSPHEIEVKQSTWTEEDWANQL